MFLSNLPVNNNFIIKISNTPNNNGSVGRFKPILKSLFWSTTESGVARTIIKTMQSKESIKSKIINKSNGMIVNQKFSYAMKIQFSTIKTAQIP